MKPRCILESSSSREDEDKPKEIDPDTIRSLRTKEPRGRRQNKANNNYDRV